MDVHDGLPLLGQPRDLRVRDGQALLLEETGAHDLDCRAVHRPLSALPRNGGEPVGSRILRSEEHTSELQSQSNLVCRLLLEKKKTDGSGRRLATPNHCSATYWGFSTIGELL